MSQQLPLNVTGTVTLDVNGDGTAQVGPRSAREQWTPAVASVKVSTNNNEATCRIYAGAAVNDGTFIDGTFTGSSGDSTDSVAASMLYTGQYVFAVWSGGDAGGLATVNVTGIRTVP